MRECLCVRKVLVYLYESACVIGVVVLLVILPGVLLNVAFYCHITNPSTAATTTTTTTNARDTRGTSPTTTTYC